jgi:hypothetical protein
MSDELSPRAIAEIDALKKQLVTSNQKYLALQEICDDQDKEIAKLQEALIKAGTQWEKDHGTWYNDEPYDEFIRDIPKRAIERLIAKGLLPEGYEGCSQ